MTEELKREICRAVETLHGWCDATKAILLCEEIEMMDARLVVEIGVFAGRSLIPMAMMMRALGNGGKVVGIDPWSAQASTEGYTGQNAAWWSEVVNHDQIYGGFMRSLETEGVVGQVEIIRKKSDEVEPMQGIDLLHVDGQHTEQAIRDVDRFARNVRRGGICCMDDIDWSNDGKRDVARAADHLKAIGFSEKFPIGTGAMFVRTKLLSPPSPFAEAARAGS